MLTGLANRMFFRECFEEALNESNPPVWQCCA